MYHISWTFSSQVNCISPEFQFSPLQRWLEAAPPDWPMDFQPQGSGMVKDSILWNSCGLFLKMLSFFPSPFIQHPINRREFRSQTSDNMQRWKSRGGKSQGGEVKKWEDKMEKVRRKKMQVRKKVRKARFTVFFQWFGAPEGRKVTSLKRRVRSHLARWEMKSCTPLWRRTRQVRTTSGSWDVEKLHAVAARSTFRSQKCSKLTVSDHFWKFRCRKSARRCGAKHISKSKRTTHTKFGPLFDVRTSKKRTPSWREAHFQVKSVKDWRVGPLFDIQMSKKCTLL